MPLKRNFLTIWYKEHYGPDADKDITPPPLPPPPPPAIITKQFYGKVLHIDGNANYLSQSLNLYRSFNIPVTGLSIEEPYQPDAILSLLTQYTPNILVITGHDTLPKERLSSLDIDDYKHSKYFAASVQLARTYAHSYDELVIIAGGCKSHYEALMAAGANFASSPGRVLINVTDPASIACKIALTSVREFVSPRFIAKDIAHGLDAFGGIETRGQCRIVEPGF